MYHKPEAHPSLSKAELAYINSDSIAETSTEKLPWSKVLFVRETWAFALAKMTDAVWWFYLFWGGKFLFDKFGLSIKSLALPLITIYVIADVGSIAGGWMSSFFIKRGWAVNRARKTTLLLCALTILPVMFVTMIPTKFNANTAFYEKLKTSTYTVENMVAVNGKVKKEKVKLVMPTETQAALRVMEGQSFTSAKDFVKAAGEVITTEQAKKMDGALIAASRSDDYYWIAVLLIALAAAGHQAWSANLFTLVSDVFPKKATASVTGIGGMLGALAGLLADLSLGKVLTSSGPAGYFFAFMIAGSCYLILLGVAHILMPKMTPLDENLRRIEK
jgi:hypothetical protein